MNATNVQLINKTPLILWNMNKKYLTTIKEAGIDIPQTKILYPQREDGKKEILDFISTHGFEKIVLKVFLLLFKL